LSAIGILGYVVLFKLLYRARNFNVNFVKWSCLFTIVACTWTIQHLNVPEQREGRDPGWLGDIKWQLKHTSRTLKWMLATVLTPEVLLAKAWSDLDAAMFELDQMKTFADKDGVLWTLAHSFLGNMGGFVIRNDSEGARWTLAQIDTASLSESENQAPKSNTNAESAQLKKTALAPDYPNPFHLIGSDIRRLREAGVLRRLPHVTTEEINDKSKSNSFARIITMFQIIWMIVQVIARATRHLAISQLEIAVVAFAACAIIIYGLNWNKPKGVNVAYTLLQYHEEIPEQVITVLKDRPMLNQIFFSELATFCPDVFGIKKFFSLVFGFAEVSTLGAPISNEDKIEDRSKSNIGFGIGSVVFGALHIAAWNFVFPTRVEQILWRATSLYCTSFILFVVFDALLPRKIQGTYAIGVSILYFLSRLFLVVEIFRTLCFLPPSAYVSTWASNIPNIS
jgi:hypothetical protein